jgi:hypothetical protein
MTNLASILNPSSQIPRELTDRKQWVLWRLVQKEDQPKPSKVPFSALTLQACNPTDPTHWATYDQALASLNRAPGYFNGLGFALLENIICIDLDNALTQRGIRIPFAQSILDQLPASFTEVSQSGHGLHWFGFGKVPGSRVKFNLPDGYSVEIYDSRRFIALTGKLFSDAPNSLAEAQPAIDALYGHWMSQTQHKADVIKLPVPSTPVAFADDQTVLHRMFAASNTASIQALWQGDTQAHNGDDSAADLALLSHLAFWCKGDAHQMERLFNQSALAQRAKWQQRQDYRQATIIKALEGYTPAPSIAAPAVVSPLVKVSIEADSLEWEPIIPLKPSLLPVEPFNTEWLPEQLRLWVKDCAERLQCPPDFIAVSCMVVLATVIGRKVGIRPKEKDSWQVIPNLWGMIIGQPSVLKTPALKEPMQALDQLERNASFEYQQALQAWEATQLIQEEQRKVLKDQIKRSLKNNDDPQQQVMEALRENTHAEPKRKRYVVNDSTVEKLGCILGDNPNGVLLFRDELAGFFHSLEKTGHEADRAFYLECWNGDGRFTYDRIGRGTLEIESACLSILGSIQPGPLQSYFAQTTGGGQGDDGLLQRFQLAVWPDLPKNWRNVDRIPCLGTRQRATNIIYDLSLMNSSEFQAATDSHNAVPFLRFSAEAQAVFTEWRTQLENTLCEQGEAPYFLAHLAKYRSLIPALALIIQLATDRHAKAVEVDAINKALGWEGYLRSHAQRIYGSVTNIRQDYALRLFKQLQKKALPNPFTSRDVYRHGWAGLNKPEGVNDALDMLEAHNIIQRVVQTTGGRRKELIFYHPEIGN